MAAALDDVQQDLKCTAQNFCLDCGVVFDSSRSLEVHISYHKENLLSKWANQSCNNTMSNNNDVLSKAGSSSFQRATQISDRTNLGSEATSQLNEIGQMYTQQPQYSINMDDSNNICTSSSRLPFQQTYAAENQDPNDGRVSYNSVPSLFAFHPLAMENYGKNIGSGGHFKTDRPVNDASAEILDLDSHKVHVYEHLHEQPFRGHSLRPQFYRPYLNGTTTFPPPPSSNHVSHWPTSLEQPSVFVPSFSFSPQQAMPVECSPPPQIINATSGILEIETVAFASAGKSFSAPSEMLEQSSRDSFKMDSSTTIFKQTNLKTENAIDSPKQPKNQKSKKVTAAAGAETSTKAKGWKGGECKRPKTYNCIACNKWFTSSGHLKRHYGTTLHKNSVRQNGDVNGHGQQQGLPPARCKKNSTKKNGTANYKLAQGSSLPIKETGITSSLEAESPSPGCSGTGNLEDLRNQHVPASIFPFKKDENSNRGDSESNNHHDASVELNSNGDQINPFLDVLPKNVSSSTTTHRQYSTPTHQFHHSLPYAALHSPFGQTYSSDAVRSFPSPTAYSIPATLIPATIYGTGYMNGEGPAAVSLPPFSSVGFSHYDPLELSYLNSTTCSQYAASLPDSSQTTADSRQLFYTTQQPAGIQEVAIAERSFNLRETSFQTQSGQSAHDNGALNVHGGSPEVARSCSIESGSADHDSNSNSSLRDTPSSGGESTREGFEMDSVVAPYRCNECSKTFGKACYLTQHTKSSHSCLSFKCNVCGKKFMELEALTDHIAKHGSDKPYKCEYTQCPKQFNHKTDLRRHLCLHTGEKPYICNICKKGFIRKDHMTKHCETHRKIKNKIN